MIELGDSRAGEASSHYLTKIYKIGAHLHPNHTLRQVRRANAKYLITASGSWSGGVIARSWRFRCCLIVLRRSSASGGSHTKANFRSCSIQSESTRNVTQRPNDGIAEANSRQDALTGLSLRRRSPCVHSSMLCRRFGWYSLDRHQPLTYAADAHEVLDLRLPGFS